MFFAFLLLKRANILNTAKPSIVIPTKNKIVAPAALDSLAPWFNIYKPNTTENTAEQPTLMKESRKGVLFSLDPVSHIP